MHFLRFELVTGCRRAVCRAPTLAIGVDHPAYRAALDPVPQQIRAALAQDLA